MLAATRDDGSRGRGHDILAAGPCGGLERRNSSGNCLSEQFSSTVNTCRAADKIRRSEALPFGRTRSVTVPLGS